MNSTFTIPVKNTKISHGDLFATKNYVNDPSESPDGTRILYRYFPDPATQPSGRTGTGGSPEMWVCKTDGTEHRKLFDLPAEWTELGHGGESMLWLGNDRFYFNGLLYSFKEERILWRIPNPVTPTATLAAWGEPVDGKMFVNSRYGSNAGYYWIDPSTDTVPELHKVLGRDELVPHLETDPANYQFTYIKQSPGGKHLYFVIYTPERGEYGFTSRIDGTDILPGGDNARRGFPWNGHTIWFDDTHMIYPDYPARDTKMCDRWNNGKITVGGWSNHITISPDRKWIAIDGRYGMKLYKIGFAGFSVDLMGPDQYGVSTDPHPSFSRDGRTVYYTGRNGASAALWAADVSPWTVPED